jgi:glyoxylate utilization-related uncharacterized protein
MENASMDDTDTTVTTTFFFSTDGKIYSCILSIVTFVIRANVEQLTNSSIYVFKQPSSSVERDFTDAILNVRGSGEGDRDGTGNDTAL